MSQRGVPILVRETPDAVPRKITRISGYGTGGFAVMTPYHQARQGFVCKMPVDYSKTGSSTIKVQNMIQAFGASHRVKLSYHGDGFAQFSGEKAGTITSGREKEHGVIKGVGLLTNPLSKPIFTGPAVAICAWGLQDFQPHEGQTANSIVYDLPTIQLRDCGAVDANALLIEIFTLPRSERNSARKLGDYLAVKRSFPGHTGPVKTFDLTVIDIPDPNVFLGILASRVRSHFTSPSGWTMGGPGSTETRGRRVRSYVLNAVYPLPNGLENLPSLDYIPPSDNQ